MWSRTCRARRSSGPLVELPQLLRGPPDVGIRGVNRYESASREESRELTFMLKVEYGSYFIGKI